MLESGIWEYIDLALLEMIWDFQCNSTHIERIHDFNTTHRMLVEIKI